MPKTIVKLECPSCGYPAQAIIQQNTMKFLLFVCPDCQSNVVYYKHRLDIISDEMVNKLIQRNKLIECGNFTHTETPPPNCHSLTSDDILDLKIVIETSKTIEEFIRNI